MIPGSIVVGASLAARLRAEDGPEVVVVSRLTVEGWLEEQTMRLLRARLHRQLQDADAHDRYRLLYPRILTLKTSEGDLLGGPEPRPKGDLEVGARAERQRPQDSGRLLKA